PDYPWGIPPELLQPVLPRVTNWVYGDPLDYTGLAFLAPNSVKDPDFVAPYRRYFRSTMSPGSASAITDLVVQSDVRELLPSVRAPALVLYRRGDQLAGKPHATYLAEHLPNAELVEVPGDENWMFVDNDEDLDQIEEFLTGTRHTPALDRILSTILF